MKWNHSTYWLTNDINITATCVLVKGIVVECKNDHNSSLFLVSTPLQYNFQQLPIKRGGVYFLSLWIRTSVTSLPIEWSRSDSVPFPNIGLKRPGLPLIPLSEPCQKLCEWDQTNLLGNETHMAYSSCQP